MSPFRFMRKTDRWTLVGLGVAALFGLGVLLGRHWPQPEAPSAVSPSPKEETPHQAAAAHEGATRDDGTAAVAQPHVFDPNAVDSATLVACGVEAWKVHTFLRYRAAGKRFYSESDLLDTYGWEDNDVRRLRPYLRFGEKPERSARAAEREERATRPAALRAREVAEDRDRDGDAPARSYPEKFSSPTVVDINAADTTLLRRIPGIGAYYAGQVVRLRERLGGFTHVEQLLEIRDFPADALAWMEVRDPRPASRLRLTDPVGQLARHPYIGYRRARALSQYQHDYGAITDSASLAATRLFSPDELRLLLPYIDF